MYVYAADAAIYAAYYAAHSAANARYRWAYYVTRAAYFAAVAIDHSGGDLKKAHADVVDIVRKRLYPGEIKL
jgi:hypothetical protein